jgi:hypothetical protein
MPILSRCSVTGCRTLTIGDVCIVHDLRPKRSFVRGRPFDPFRTSAGTPVLAVAPRRAPRADVVGTGFYVD